MKESWWQTLEFGHVGIASLVLYLGALVAVAEFARRSRRDLSPGDHFLAGRELGLFVLFLTLYATAYSGNSLLGYPGRAYRSGFSFISATGFMMAIIVMFHALAPKLRVIATRHRFITPGDWVRHRFGEERGGRALLACIGILMALAMVNFLLAQLKAMGHVTAGMSGDRIPYWAGVVGLAGMILFYETRGGMRAVAWTDAAQGVLMVGGLAALLAWLMAETGGIEMMTREVARIRPDAVAVPDASVNANWFSTIALLGLGSVIYPQAIQRIYAARSGRVLRNAFALMTFMPLVTTFVVTLIGIAAIAQLEGLVGAQSDAVVPELLARWAQAGPGSMALAVLVFVGALAAIMSTADSCLLSLGSIVARDLLGGVDDSERTTRVGKWVAGLLLAAMIPLALQQDVTLWRLIELKMELLIQCVPTFLLAIHWGWMRTGPTLLGLLVGTGFSVTLTLLGYSALLGVHVGIVGLVLNGIIAVGGSLWVGLRAPVSVRA